MNILTERQATQQELVDLLTAIKGAKRALLILGETEVIRLTELERGQVVTALKEGYGMSDQAISLATMEWVRS